MQPGKKELEVLIMEYFRKSYENFPAGKLRPGESPDFTINMKNFHVLGIELTRLNPANAAPPDQDMKVEIGLHEDLIDSAKNLFEQSSGLKLFVKFLFSDDKKIKSENKLILVVQVVNSIRDAVKNKNGQAFYRLLIESTDLPDGIENLLIVYHPGMVLSVWERSNNLGISNDVIGDLKKAIHKKDEKLRLYQKNHLNYYWLLITTDRLRSVKNFNLPNKILNYKFESRFQHVFLFDLLKADIYQLK